MVGRAHDWRRCAETRRPAVAAVAVITAALLSTLLTLAATAFTLAAAAAATATGSLRAVGAATAGSRYFPDILQQHLPLAQ